MQKNKKILDKIKRLNLYTLLGSLILVAFGSICIDYYFYRSSLVFLNKKQYTQAENRLQSLNSRIIRYTLDSYYDIDGLILKRIKEQSIQGKKVVDAILLKYKNKTDKEKLEHIDNALRFDEFFNNRGYYFIIDGNGRMILNSVFPDLENTRMYEDDYILEAIKVMKDGDSGVFKGLMRKPNTNSDELFLKWSYLNRIAGTDWYIGTGEYYYEFIEEYKSQLLDDICILNNNNNVFFYIIDIVSNSFIVRNNNILDDHESIIDTESKLDDKILEEAIKVTQKNGSDFMNFHFSKDSDDSTESALVHVVKIPELNWLIASGIYKTEISAYFNADKHLFKNKAILNLIVLLSIIILVVIMYVIFNNRILKILKKLFNTLEIFFNDSMQTNQLINKDNLKYEEFTNIADSVNKMLISKKEIFDSLTKDKIYVDQLMIENPEAIALVDKDSLILKINPAFTKLYGYVIDDIRGKNIDHVLCQPKELVIAEKNTMKVASGVTTKFYANRLAKNGKVMNMFITGVPVIVKGKVEAVFAIYQDKTEIIEQEIALRITSDQALEATKTKAQFLANMSHEIRTPMNGVIGMTDLLAKTQLSEEQSDYVDTIRVSGESLLRVINDILDFSKLESGKYYFNLSDFELTTCIEKALDVIALKVQEKGVKLSYSIDEDVPIYIYSDFDRLKQVLINLVNNSYKFTNTGFIMIKVSLDSYVNNEYTLKFEVSDTGIGIPKDKLNSIFDSFSQVDSSSSRNYTGTGLGLAISKAIITYLKGSIWVDSKLNIGSKFYFTIKTESKVIVNKNNMKASGLFEKKIGVIANRPEFDNIKTILKLNVKSLEQIADCESLNTIGNFYENWDVLIIDYYIYESFTENINTIIKNINFSSLLVIFLKNLKDQIKTNDDLNANIQFVNYPLHKNKLLEKMNDAYGLVKDKSNDVEDIALTEAIKNLKILIAEDNVINQKLMQKLFHKLGVESDLAVDGQEALEMALDHEYDLIFMDIQMPRLDGLKATMKIKESLLDKAPVIVALTANVLPEDKEKCIDVGMVAFLPKPVRIKDIEKILHKYLKKELL